MVEPLTSTNVRLSPENLKRIRDSEDLIVDSLLGDLNAPEPNVRKEARATLIRLGFTQKKDKAKEVVALLLEKAREGKFGEQARSFQKATERVEEDDAEKEIEAEAVEEEVKEGDPYLEQLEKGEEEPPVSKVPLIAVDAVEKPDNEDPVDSFATMQKKKKPSSRARRKKPKTYNFGSA